MVYVSAIGIEMKILFFEIFLFIVKELKFKKKIVMDSPTFSCAAYCLGRKRLPKKKLRFESFFLKFKNRFKEIFGEIFL